MLQKKWFRIESYADGSIASCEEVEVKGRNGSVVRFYEAADNAEACAQASAWFREQQLRFRSDMKTRSERGLCLRCKKRLVNGACERCAAVKERANVRASGKAPPVTGGAAPSHQAGAMHSAAVRGHTWQLLLRRFDELGPVAFRAWLVSKIPAMQQDTGVQPIAEAAE